MITKDPFGISRAELPWSGPGSRKRERIYTHDTPEQMARCESCPLPECTDCIGENAARYATHRNTKRDAWFMDLYGQGLTDREIAAAMDVSKTTICYHRKRHGLLPTPPDRQRTPAPHARAVPSARPTVGRAGKRRGTKPSNRCKSIKK